jgi:hypothetical protein
VYSSNIRFGGSRGVTGRNPSHYPGRRFAGSRLPLKRGRNV